VERGGLRIVAGGAAAEAVGASPDPAAFQEECLRAFGASQVARGFSELTIVNGSGTLQRFLDACGRPAWEVTREDVDRVVGELAAQGLAASTRRGYVQAFKNFHAFLAVRKAAEIEAAFGIRLEDPVDEFNAARRVSADSLAAEPRRARNGWRTSSPSCGNGSPARASTRSPAGITPCSGPCISPGCALTRRR
jgi:integrase/recombinase XerD